MPEMRCERDQKPQSRKSTLSLPPEVMKRKIKQGTLQKKSLTRVAIIDALNHGLAKIPYVHAFWEGGAAAWGRVDEWSDIDAYLLVDEGRIGETFEEVEHVLTSLSPIKQRYAVIRNPWPGLSQVFYSLEDASHFLVLDLGILTSNSPSLYLEPEIHGRSIFYFNKTGIDETTAVDRLVFERKKMDDMKWLKDRFNMFSNYVEKEIRRGNSIEAIENYRTIIIPSLVQALRSKYTPMHYDFRTRYIHYELAEDIVEKLKELCFVSSLPDLEAKNTEAIRWFEKLAA
jgi:hypothetical protein